MSDPYARGSRGMAMDELEPDYDNPDDQPKTLTKSRHHKNVFWLAGRHQEDNVESEIMFVTSAVDEDEMTRVKRSLFGHSVMTDAEYLKGPTGVVKDVALRAGLDMDKLYYTALVKWLLPRTKRNKPPVKVLKYGMPVLLDEIKRVKPKIIVCLGKQVFDQLSDRKISFDDAHGAWFWSEEHKAHMYVMYAPYSLVSRPEMYETFRIDFQEIARKRDIINGVGVDDVPARWTVLRDEASLRSWVMQMRIENNHLYAVDCEWHGKQHRDADLRSIQMAWTESDAMVTLFRNEKNQWAFEFLPATAAKVKANAEEAFARRKAEGIPTTYEKELKVARYKAAGEIIEPIIADPQTELIGHHFAADAVMIETWLGIDTYQKCVLDTEFAQQTIDESSELDLERGIAMKYTTLGFYSQALIEWKRQNRKLCEDGYGYIPESIIVPYSALDVIAPFRAYPKLRKQLEAQKLWEYYRNIHNPFVTDVFTGMSLCGLPMDRERMDDLREVFHFARRHLEVSLKRNIHQAAKVSVFGKIFEEFDMDLVLAHAVTHASSAADALNLVKQASVVKNVKIDVVLWNKRLGHMFESADFNIRSPEMMRRWLYDVEGLTPIKSTNQKAKGMPSMAWEKVMDLPEERQKLYVPAVDKQTIQILSTRLPLLDELLSLNAVGNVCKAFLKEAELIPVDIDDCLGDDDDGESEDGKFNVKEHGLHAWLSSPFDDGVSRVLGMMSCTETSRPRAWRPNCLNWPAYVSERIGKAVVKALIEANETGELPVRLVKWLSAKSEKDIPSIRSCVKAPPGWVFVESDYQTAEMVALAVISGDKKLMRILFEADPEWASLKEKKYGEDKVRVAWSSTQETGIPQHLQRSEFLMHVWKEGKCLGPVSESDLARNPDGSVKHAKFDIHWSVVERTYEMPREMMVTKIHRNAGKVLNFCVAKNAEVLTPMGAKPIQSVSADDLVWDGSDWVGHRGVVESGIKPVVVYQGLAATREHDVWDSDGRKRKFGELADFGLDLLRAGPDPDSSSLPEHGALVETYDILDAGPRNRFTCSGVLVSNSSAYGASPASLDRKIESDTGVKPEDGTGEKGLEAIATRQPRATAFLEELARVPKERGYYRAASGRIRHCVLHGRNADISWRARNAQESALGRELRNFPKCSGNQNWVNSEKALSRTSTYSC